MLREEQLHNTPSHYASKIITRSTFKGPKSFFSRPNLCRQTLFYANDSLKKGV